MSELEIYVLREVVKLMPQFGLDYSVFEYETDKIITSATLYNWAQEKTVPQPKKYNVFMYVLKTQYREIYDKIIKAIETKNNCSISDMFDKEYKELLNLVKRRNMLKEVTMRNVIYER